jgi:predicted TIM-barrel fold metal-dependent hydrolase
MRKRMPGSREDDSWFSDAQLTKVAPAETERFHSPIPTRMVSNGEYMPVPQTEKQKRVEARTKELADSAAKKLGISRRKFLASTGGMAAGLLAMNEVFGRFFNVSPVEMFEPAAYAATGVPTNLFVLDDQTHMVRYTQTQGRSLRAVAQGPGAASTAAGWLTNPFNPMGLLDEGGSPWRPWNPEHLLNQPDSVLLHADFPPNTGSEFHLVQYIQRMFLESQVTVAILSNANLGSILEPGQTVPRPPKNITENLGVENLTGHMTAAVRDFVNQIAGSTRMLAHGQIYPGIGNHRGNEPVYRDFTQWQIDTFHPDSWKGYNVAFAAKLDTNPDSLMARWQLDDEAVAYPFYEVVVENSQELKKRPGFFNICVHKGLSTNAPPDPRLGAPTDIPKAARDWPQLNFIIYHSCIRPGFWCYNALQDILSGRLRNAANEVGVDVAEGVPDILWSTEFAVLSAPFQNVYAELGTTFASTVVTFPTVWAHIIGQLLKFMGDDRVVFGSDSLWYGGPQWQIEAFWRFQIPDDMRQQYGYPELTPAAKRKILGGNSAKLYKLAPAAEASPHGKYKPVPDITSESQVPASLLTLLEFSGQANDTFSKMRRQYAEMGGERSNTRYGWIRTRV